MRSLAALRVREAVRAVLTQTRATAPRGSCVGTCVCVWQRGASLWRGEVSARAAHVNAAVLVCGQLAPERSVARQVHGHAAPQRWKIFRTLSGTASGAGRGASSWMQQLEFALEAGDASGIDPEGLLTIRSGLEKTLHAGSASQEELHDAALALGESSI